MRCSEHPGVETNLTCSKCGKPICPKCLIQTPVGARCADCAQLRRIPTYNISTLQYAKAFAVAIFAALVSGIAWGRVQSWLSFISLDFLLAIVIGYAIGELVSLSINKRRGTWLQAVAGMAVVLSYITSRANLVNGHIEFFFFFDIWSLFALAIGILMARSRLR